MNMNMQSHHISKARGKLSTYYSQASEGNTNVFVCISEAFAQTTSFSFSQAYSVNNTRLLYNENKGGYIILVSVLVVGAIGVAITLSLILLGIGTSRTSFAYEQSNQAKGLANACAEEAMQRIRDSTPFIGSGSLTLGQGTCNYTVTTQGPQDRTIIASGTVDTIIRKVRVIINRINPTIQVVSWQEIADF